MDKEIKVQHNKVQYKDLFVNLDAIVTMFYSTKDQGILMVYETGIKVLYPINEEEGKYLIDEMILRLSNKGEYILGIMSYEVYLEENPPEEIYLDDGDDAEETEE